MQIQFHVFELKQEFEGNLESWSRSYIKHFVLEAKKRSEKMIEKFVRPFEKYLI